MKMKKQAPLLTIGIPTFNRPSELVVSIESVVSQLNQKTIENLEILVSDNCSAEDSNSVLEHLSRWAPNLHIFRNGTNIGYDRNIQNIFEKAQGEFVLILADDDRLKKDALSLVFNVVEQGNTDIILFETDFFDSELKHGIDIEEDFFQSVGATKFFLTGENLLTTLDVEFFGGITGYCMRRSLWLKSEPQRFFDSNWIHLGVLLSVVSNSSITIVREKYFDYRMDNKHSRWKQINVSLGIAKIYANSALLNYRSCRIGYDKYRKEFLISILRKRVSLREFPSLVTGVIRLQESFLRIQFFKDLLILFVAAFMPKILLNRYLDWRSS